MDSSGARADGGAEPVGRRHLSRVGGDVLRPRRESERRAIAIQDGPAQRVDRDDLDALGRGGVGVVGMVDGLQLDEPAADHEQHHGDDDEGDRHPAIQPAQEQHGSAPGRAAGWPELPAELSVVMRCWPTGCRGRWAGRDAAAGRAAFGGRMGGGDAGGPARVGRGA